MMTFIDPLNEIFCRTQVLSRKEETSFFNGRGLILDVTTNLTTKSVY